MSNPVTQKKFCRALDIAVAAGSLDWQSLMNGQAVWPVIAARLDLFIWPTYF